MWSKTKYSFRRQKEKDKPCEPNNGIWAPKSVGSCDISIDREFYMEQEKIIYQSCPEKKSKLEKPIFWWTWFKPHHQKCQFSYFYHIVNPVLPPTTFSPSSTSPVVWHQDLIRLFCNKNFTQILNNILSLQL
jgi:hypothetical protein